MYDAQLLDSDWVIVNYISFLFRWLLKVFVTITVSKFMHFVYVTLIVHCSNVLFRWLIQIMQIYRSYTRNDDYYHVWWYYICNKNYSWHETFIQEIYQDALFSHDNLLTAVSHVHLLDSWTIHDLRCSHIKPDGFIEFL